MDKAHAIHVVELLQITLPVIALLAFIMHEFFAKLLAYFLKTEEQINTLSATVSNLNALVADLQTRQNATDAQLNIFQNVPAPQTPEIDTSAFSTFFSERNL